MDLSKCLHPSEEKHEQSMKIQKRSESDDKRLVLDRLSAWKEKKLLNSKDRTNSVDNM